MSNRISAESVPLEARPYIHKVGKPPKQNLAKEFTSTLKETLFPDDPLRQFKDQPRSKKFLLGIRSVFPILDWGRHYSLGKLKGDLIAGLTIASLCIPQDIGYAKLAGLEPQYGLCEHTPHLDLLSFFFVSIQLTSFSLFLVLCCLMMLFRQ